MVLDDEEGGEPPLKFFSGPKRIKNDRKVCFNFVLSEPFSNISTNVKFSLPTCTVDYWSVSNSVKWNIHSLDKYPKFHTGISIKLNLKRNENISVIVFLVMKSVLCVWYPVSHTNLNTACVLMSLKGPFMNSSFT